MFNVDTLGIVLNFRNPKIGTIADNAKEMIIADMKIKSKLYYDAENLEKMKLGRNDLAMKGYSDGYSFYYNCEWYSLTVTAPHFKIEKYTAGEIITDVRNTVMNFFELKESEMVDINLSRLDIKNDHMCEPSEELQIIKNILKKARDKFRFYTKYILIDNENGFLVKYNSKKKNKYGETFDVTRQSFKMFNLHKKQSINNEASAYDFDENDTDDVQDENGNYIEYAFYDKSEEIKIKVNSGRADASEIKKYKNIFRSEIRIKNGRLNSNKFENPFMTKELKNYYNETTTNILYDKYIKDILGTKDFYRIDVAVNIVENSNFKPKKRQALAELLLLVNEYGYTKAEQLWLDNHCKSSLYNYLHTLEELHVNILTFDQKIDEVEIKTEKIPNFGQRSNAIQDI